MGLHASSARLLHLLSALPWQGMATMGSVPDSGGCSAVMMPLWTFSQMRLTAAFVVCQVGGALLQHSARQACDILNVCDGTSACVCSAWDDSQADSLSHWLVSGFGWSLTH